MASGGSKTVRYADQRSLGDNKCKNDIQREVCQYPDADFRFDLNQFSLGEIHSKTLAAINEHKDTITNEYKDLKREADLERGNWKSEIRLARKEKRSKRHIEQLENSEYNNKKELMNRLHNTLMKHHISLSNVEERCLEAMKEESLDFVQMFNKLEIRLWKQICQDIHQMLNLQPKGFRMKAKWKQINMTVNTIKATLVEGRREILKLYSSNGLQPEVMGIYQAASYIDDIDSQLTELLTQQKSKAVEDWLSICEDLKELMSKQTQLLKSAHKQRLRFITDECDDQLKKSKEYSNQRHENLMQKIADEHDTLSKEQTEIRVKHNDRKSRSKNTHHHDNHHRDNRHHDNHHHGNHHHDSHHHINQRHPHQMQSMPNLVSHYGGVPGMGGLYGGGFSGMHNFNMSNAVGLLTSEQEGSSTPSLTGYHSDQGVANSRSISTNSKCQTKTMVPMIPAETLSPDYTRLSPEASEQEVLNALSLNKIIPLSKHEIIGKYLQLDGLAANQFTTISLQDLEVKVLENSEIGDKNYNTNAEKSDSDSESSDRKDSDSLDQENSDSQHYSTETTKYEGSSPPIVEDDMQFTPAEPKLKKCTGSFHEVNKVIDKLIQCCCPCLRNKYEKYKESREEQKRNAKITQ